jgi:hypothetical protein
MSLQVIGISVIWINKTALSLTNYPYYRSEFMVYRDSNLGLLKDFTTLPPMFGIPGLYYPKNTTL